MNVENFIDCFIAVLIKINPEIKVLPTSEEFLKKIIFSK